jgi:hypothetical protein
MHQSNSSSTDEAIASASGHPAAAVDPADFEAAKAVLRVARGHRVNQAVLDRVRASERWEPLLTSTTQTRVPEWRASWPQEWLSYHGPRDPAEADVMRRALAAAEADDPTPDDSTPDEPDGPKEFKLEPIDSTTFFSTRYVLRWLVEHILVADQPCVIGGPKKSLKTSILVDLAISLATAGRFLGEFIIRQPTRVGFFSGESGGATIQDTARRVCEAKGIETKDLGDIVWCFRLPQLSLQEHLIGDN